MVIVAVMTTKCYIIGRTQSSEVRVMLLGIVILAFAVWIVAKIIMPASWSRFDKFNSYAIVTVLFAGIWWTASAYICEYWHPIYLTHRQRIDVKNGVLAQIVYRNDQIYALRFSSHGAEEELSSVDVNGNSMTGQCIKFDAESGSGYIEDLTTKPNPRITWWICLPGDGTSRSIHLPHDRKLVAEERWYYVTNRPSALTKGKWMKFK